MSNSWITGVRIPGSLLRGSGEPSFSPACWLECECEGWKPNSHGWPWGGNPILGMADNKMQESWVPNAYGVNPWPLKSKLNSYLAWVTIILLVYPPTISADWQTDPLLKALLCWNVLYNSEFGWSFVPSDWEVASKSLGFLCWVSLLFMVGL